MILIELPYHLMAFCIERLVEIWKVSRSIRSNPSNHSPAGVLLRAPGGAVRARAHQGELRAREDLLTAVPQTRLDVNTTIIGSTLL